jgi:hypothetical protein
MKRPGPFAEMVWVHAVILKRWWMKRYPWLTEDQAWDMAEVQAREIRLRGLSDAARSAFGKLVRGS